MMNGKSLREHSVKMPFVIFCISGDDELIFHEDKKVKLKPGRLISIETNVFHNVIAKPKMPLLLIRFVKDEIKGQAK